jgi:hypothetical protein
MITPRDARNYDNWIRDANRTLGHIAPPVRGPRYYGAHGDGVHDDLRAFEAMVDDMPDSGDLREGGLMQIDGGVFFLDGPWRITKPVWVRGAGRGYWDAVYGATRLQFPPGVRGIEVPATTRPVHLEGLWVRGAATGPGPDDGLYAQGQVYVRECAFTEFGRDGVRLDTTAGGNVNLSRLVDVQSRYNRQHGFHLTGPDTQACTLSGCDATSNLGWGFYNADCAQNKYDHCHASDNTLGALALVNSSTTQIDHLYSEVGTGDNVSIDADCYYGMWRGGVYGGPPVTWGGEPARQSWVVLQAGWPGDAGNGYSGPGLVVYGGAARVEGTTVRLLLKDTDAAANEKVWRWLVSGNTLALQTFNDAEDTAAGVLYIDRIGNAPFSANFQIPVSGTSLALSGSLGANGATPSQPTLAAAATDPATTQTLANSLRSALLALGLCQP